MISKGTPTAYVRESCKALCERAKIKIDLDKIDELLNAEILSNGHTEAEYAKLSQSFTFSFPLVFDNQVQELNLIGLLGVLNLESEFNQVLYAETGRGALDAIKSLVFSSYLASNDAGNGSDEADLLTSKGMTLTTPSALASHMRISIVVEKPHPTMPAITVGEQGGPLLAFVVRVAEILRGVGEVLLKSGYANIGTFLAEGLKAAKGDPDELLLRLIKAFPSVFVDGDQKTILDQEAATYSKAVHLILMMGRHFRPTAPLKESSSFSSSVPDSSASQERVVPGLGHVGMATAMIHTGILDFSECAIPSLQQLTARISLPEQQIHDIQSNEKGVPSESRPRRWVDLTSNDVFVVEAASVHACDIMAERARNKVVVGWRSPIASAELSAWFNGKLSDENYRWRSLPDIVVATV